MRSRQLRASSPASSRASGGARVRARVEEEIMTAVRCVFIGTGAALRYYTGAPGDSNMKDTWLSCNTSEVVPRSHARPGLSGGRSHFSGFQVKGFSIENGLMFVPVSSAEDAEKTF